MEMTEEKAREILEGNMFFSQWSAYSCDIKHYFLYLEGDYTADQLEAMAWWMRNKGGEDGIRN